MLAEPVEEAHATPPPQEDATTEDRAEETASTDVVVVEADPYEMERTHTLRQLKDMCAERGLLATGKKRELVERLVG